MSANKIITLLIKKSCPIWNQILNFTIQNGLLGFMGKQLNKIWHETINTFFNIIGISVF